MEQALFIVKTLTSRGYLAYFAGGWVRDYLLNHPSDDIDIATNASPEIIESLFDHTIPIGKAFGIILVIVQKKQYEVATFRQDIEYKDGRRPTKIQFSSPEADAQRRDFTINGMFYDPIEEEIIDYVSGRDDLEKKIIRCIGNPHQRIKEDRLRMIRAVRLSARFNFEIEQNTKNAIISHATELFPSVAIERIVQEFSKMALYRGFKKALITLFEFNLLQTIFPDLKNITKEEIEKRLAPVDDFSHHAPISISILELYPHYSLDQKIKVCQYLKRSNEDIEFVIFFDHAKYLMKNEKKTTRYEWTLFYSNPLSELALQILAVHVNFKKRKAFLTRHEKRQKKLQFYIERIINKDPIVKSHHLLKHDIQPSALMGQLLMEAQKIAVNQKKTDPQKIIKKLKKLPIWPKK